MRSAAVHRTLSPLLLSTAVALAGCWTRPVADVQPKGEARLIESAITVESAKAPAIVESLDRDAGTIVSRIPGAPKTSTYKVGREVQWIGIGGSYVWGANITGWTVGADVVFRF